MLDIDITVERIKRYSEKQILAGDSALLTLAVLSENGDTDVYAGIA